MNNLYQIKYILLFLSLLFFSSCFTSIKSIVNNPERFDQKKVRIKGRVVSSIELDDLNVFYLQSRNHTLAVITEGYLPMKNEFIIVKGQVFSEFKYHSRWNMQVIYEKIKIRNRKSKDSDYKYINKKYFKTEDYP
jgi:hypothetical protein